MGHLLSAGVKMQNSVSTATLQYLLYAGGNSGTFTIYINGSAYQTMTTDTSLVTVTVNAGDTFYATIASVSGTTIYYYLNGGFVAGYFDTSPTPTVTASAGNTYFYEAYFGAA